MAIFKVWQHFKTLFGRNKPKDLVDLTSSESFPASDPPGWAGFDKSTVKKSIPDENNPFSILKEEHQTMMKKVYEIYDLIVALEKNEPVSLEKVREIKNFIQDFIEEHHFPKEEGILFPLAEQEHLSCSDCNYDTLEQDHIESKLLLDRIENFTKNYNKNEMIYVLQKLKDIYTRHVLTEENILFPYLEKNLNKDVQKKIYNDFNH